MNIPELDIDSCATPALAAMNYERSFTKGYIEYKGVAFIPRVDVYSEYAGKSLWYNVPGGFNGAQHSDNPARYREVFTIKIQTDAKRMTSQRYHGALEHNWDYLHDGGIALRLQPAWQAHFDARWAEYYAPFFQYLGHNNAWPVPETIVALDQCLYFGDPRATFANRERRAVSRRRDSAISLLDTLIQTLRQLRSNYYEVLGWYNLSLGEFYPFAIENFLTGSITLNEEISELVKNWYGEEGSGTAEGALKYEGRYGPNYEVVKAWCTGIDTEVQRAQTEILPSLIPHSFAGDLYWYHEQVETMVDECKKLVNLAIPLTIVDWFNPAYPENQMPRGDYIPLHPEIDFI